MGLSLSIEFMKIPFRSLSLLILFIFFAFVPAFAQNENKAGIAILIDNTGSLRGQFDKILSLAKTVIENSDEQEFFSVFHFKAGGSSRNPSALITSGTEWSQNKNAAKTFIEDLFIVPGSTTLYDAIDSIAKISNAKAEALKFTAKRIVLITDGEDRSSKINQKQLIENLKADGIKVYAVGLVEELENEGGIVQDSKRVKATDFLNKITKETGGNVVFPKRKENKSSEDLIKELFAQ